MTVEKKISVDLPMGLIARIKHLKQGKDLDLIERSLQRVQKEHVAHSCSPAVGEYHEFFSSRVENCPWCLLLENSG